MRILENKQIHRRGLTLFALSALCASALTGCGGNSGSYRDGTYMGQSSIYEGDEDGSGAGYGVATLTLAGGQIVDCVFETYEPDGTLKDENYGKQDGAVANQDFYNKAQRAVRASANYGEQLAEKGELKAVDAISGATYSYQEFQEAVNDALKKAKG